MITAPDPREISEASPTLAWISMCLRERPYYFCGEPFPVVPEVYDRAEKEMKVIMQLRGWKETLPINPQLGRQIRDAADQLPHWVGTPNFLLMGTPIVPEREG